MEKKFIMFEGFIIDKNTITSVTNEKENKKIIVTTLIEGEYQDFIVDFDSEYTLSDAYLKLVLALNPDYIGPNIDTLLVKRLRNINNSIIDLGTQIKAALKALKPKKKKDKAE